MNETSSAGQLAAASTRYRSYVLRLWATGRSGVGGWRASLENPQTGRCIGFASLEELFIFLLEQSEGDAEAV